MIIDHTLKGDWSRLVSAQWRCGVRCRLSDVQEESLTKRYSCGRNAIPHASSEESHEGTHICVFKNVSVNMMTTMKILVITMITYQKKECHYLTIMRSSLMSLKASKGRRRVATQGIVQTWFVTSWKERNLSLSERVMSRRKTQDDIRPGPLSLCENEEIFTLTSGGFGQPTIGPCAELHTRDQRARLLAISNFKEGWRCLFMSHSRDVASVVCTLRWHLATTMHSSMVARGGNPPITWSGLLMCKRT